MCRYICIFIYCLYLLLPGKAVAQLTAKDTLRIVQVNARRIPDNINPITPVQTLSGRRLETLNSLSVADAVRYFSGVQLKDYGGIGGLKTINVRSMGSQHTAVFYDGLMISNAQNGQVDLSKFTLDNIDAISLYNGQSNNIFQTARAFSAGNVLYLTSKTPQFSGNETWHGKASIKTGSSGLINPSLLWQQKLSDRISSTVSAEWVNANGRYKYRMKDLEYDSTAFRQNGNINAYRLEAGLNGTLRDSSTWNLKYYYYNSSRGLPGAVVANKYKYGQHLNDQDMFAQASWKKEVPGRFGLMANVKYSNFFNVYIDPEYLNEARYLDNYYRQQEIYASVAGKYNLTSYWGAALATDMIINTMGSNIRRFAEPTRYTELVSLASRLHFKQLEVQGNILATIVDESVKAYNGAGSKREYTPAVSAAWQPIPGKNLWLRAFYKNIFRMPTFNDLYYTYIGNNNLRPEFVKQYDAGFTYTTALRGKWQYISIQADGYYNNVRDKIVAQPAENLFGWMMMNIGKVVIKGAEVNVNTAFMPLHNMTLNMSLSYTYQDARDMTTGKGGYNYGEQIPYTPWHSGALTAGLDWRAFTFNYSFLYTGERYFQKRNTPDNYMPSWYTSDISASWTIRRVKFSAELNNMLDQQFDVVRNFPMPGRNYRITMNIHY
ncbi:MAG TPA: TonB-dependent receptor [Chitinophaga sp.]|uniref:TonB-dependent receptor n=1 Tax=Chitinophaga sp. TaxID=1869181 RepID=UPI002BF59A1A|nr:TonB-dependent receptor [Chitinophaga sp.]HVI44082.1 TonB-dependent receptor [Chitinophaga sp.]